MTRTLLVGTGAEVALDTASTLSNATVIRVYNTHASNAYTVIIAKTSSGGFINTATVTVPANTVEFFEKGPNDQISASNSAVKGFKVGFTG